MTTRNLSRRQFLRYTALGLGATAAGTLLSGLTGCSGHVTTSHTPRAPAVGDAGGTPSEARSPDIELDLYATADDVQIRTGPPTRVWRYRAEVRRGRSDAVLPIEDSYLGPILRFRKGEAVRIHFHNGLAEPSIVHEDGIGTQLDGEGKGGDLTGLKPA